MKKYFGLLFFWLGSIIVITVNAQENKKDYSIALKSIRLTPIANAQQWLDSFKNTTAKNQTVQVIIQFYQLPTIQQRTELTSLGIELKDYLPHFAFTALLNQPSGNIATSAFGIRSIVPIIPTWKIDEPLNNLLQNPTNKRVNVLVAFYKNEWSKANILGLLKEANASITDKKFESLAAFEILIPVNQLMSLAANPYVVYINLARKPVALNDDVRDASGVGLLNPNFTDSLTGKGITLGVGDNCAGIYHADTRDRVINFNPFPGVEHGSHTTGTSAGKGIVNPRAMGMAHDAQVLGLFFDLGWIQTENLFPQYNMTLTNNSYAAVVGDCGYAGTYDQYAHLLDDVSYNNPEVLHVFAAANDGLMTCNGYAQGYATVAGGYQPAKNNLVVGGIRKNYVLAEKSSRGPVKDGRLKPEILSIGWGVLSCTTNDQYVSINGTSMACPGVVGGLALLSQQYHKQFGNTNNPRADLLKALMLNGAVDLGNPGPDYLHGFGLMNVLKSVDMLKGGRYLQDSVANGNQKTFSVNVPANTAQLKITMTYADIPAAALANDALVNNLDLEVTEPNNTIHHPFILNPSIAGVNNNAVEGVDTLNNTEQVVINNPTAGNYTITIKGSLVTTATQSFAVAYDFIPSGLKLKFPAQNVSVAGNDTTRIYWDVSQDYTNPINVDYSTNGGGTWNNIAYNFPAHQKYFTWNVPNIVTSNAMVRISYGSQQDVSGEFAIAPQPIVELDSIQCPGYINIKWNQNPNIYSYEVMRKKGAEMVTVATVNGATNYTLSGLHADSTYYVAVRPVVNNWKGVRSLAIIRKPNDGNCMGNISNNDLKIDSVLNLHSGRKLTSTELSSNQTVSVSIKNLDDNPIAPWKLSYQLNGGSWQSQSFTNSIAPQQNYTASINGLNLSAVGNYVLKVAVQNLQSNDPVKTNDTAVVYFKQIDNAPVDLAQGFNDDFESNSSFTISKDSIGISSNNHWDYELNTYDGRLRNYVSKDVLISGNKSLSMDLSQNDTNNQNYLSGTFNLAAYDTANTEARMELDYKFHGQPKFEEGNQIWARGNDTAPWIPLVQFDTTAANVGIIHHTGSLSLTHLLQQNHQQFSSSFQIRIGQHDTSVIAMNDYGNGLTFDNFKLYSVKNDLQVINIVSPDNFYCDAAKNVPVTIKIYNSDNLPQYQFKVHYQLNGAAINTQTIDSIVAKDTLLFSFNTKIAQLNSLQQYTLNVWLEDTSDSYHTNDSILNYHIRIQKLVDSFPALENFENSNGNWYTEGKNSSWEYGKPNGTTIKDAASGQYAWATNLSGNYNNNEHSYLYSPCFYVSRMVSPALSFSITTDIEDCGDNICDYLSLEYSFDGKQWWQLNPPGGGIINWFNSSAGWKGTDSRWRVASVFLPQPYTPLRLRFVFHSDAGTTKDGVAIDDIHIYDHAYGICNETEVSVSNTMQHNTEQTFTNNNQILGTITSSTADSGRLNLYQHNSIFAPGFKQYFLPRNYVVNAPPALFSSDNSVGVKLFITDNEFLQLLNDNTCSNCTKAPDVYRMGMTEYIDAKDENLDGSLLNNTNGGYENMDYYNIRWVPYDVGYYAQTRVFNRSEVWFHLLQNGKANSNVTLFPNPVTNQSFTLQWQGKKDETYELAVLDMMGRKLFESSGVDNDFDNYTVVNLPNLASGVYVVKLTSSSTQLQQKILVK
jgi:hypothetical protein